MFLTLHALLLFIPAHQFQRSWSSSPGLVDSDWQPRFDYVVSGWILACFQIWLMQSSCIPLPPLIPTFPSATSYTVREWGCWHSFKLYHWFKSILSKPTFISDEYSLVIWIAGAVKQLYIYVSIPIPQGIVFQAYRYLRSDKEFSRLESFLWLSKESEFHVIEI